MAIDDKLNIQQAELFYRAQHLADKKGRVRHPNGTSVETSFEKDSLKIKALMEFYQAGYLQTVTVYHNSECVFNAAHQSVPAGIKPNPANLDVFKYVPGSWNEQLISLSNSLKRDYPKLEF